MQRQRLSSGGIRGILRDPKVRKVEHQGRDFWAAIDVLDELMLEGDANRAWEEIRTRRPEISKVTERVVVQDGTEVDALDLEGILRLTQSVGGERAERVRWWLAEAGREKLEESDNPEVALIRARKLYEQQGHDRKWVDKRLRGMSARQELTAEWYKRGARASDEFRELTNELMRETFGVDVEQYRQQKGLTGSQENLRDHMNDLELALTTLAETAAAALHREHHSATVEQLKADTHEAGQVAAHTRAELERALGHRLADPSGASSTAAEPEAV